MGSAKVRFGENLIGTEHPSVYPSTAEEREPRNNLGWIAAFSAFNVLVLLLASAGSVLGRELCPMPDSCTSGWPIALVAMFAGNVFMLLLLAATRRGGAVRVVFGVLAILVGVIVVPGLTLLLYGTVNWLLGK